MKSNFKHSITGLICILLTGFAFGQNREVSGNVTDESNVPLAGVTVQIKDQSVGTVTDFDGNFSLNIPDDPDLILLFSYLGFSPTEITVGTQSRFDVALKADSQNLDEVIIVGYGTQERSNLTSAVSQVNADDIALRPAANITQALQGQLPGLNIQVNTGDPAATPDINVRGFNSINGGGPLILIDGIQGDITRVNPQDIESVTVLKDAASAAIYGARGAFGVVLITTKTGKSGDMVVDYTNNFSWTTPTTRTDFISNPYDYGRIVDASINGYNGTNITGYNSDLDWETIQMVANGEIDPFYEPQANGTNKFFYNTNWYDYLFKKWQPSQMHNLSISGGSEKLKGYLSGRIFERETVQKIQDGKIDRYNLKSSVTFSPSDWIEFSDNIFYTNEQDMEYSGYRTGYGGPWSNIWFTGIYPFHPASIDGIPTDIGRSGTGGLAGLAALVGGNNWRKINIDEFRNTFRTRLFPVKGMEINFDYSNTIQHTANTYRLTPFDVLSTARLTYETTGMNRVSEYRNRQYYNALNAFATYSFDLNNMHNFKILGGYNQEEFNQDNVLAEGDGLLVRDLYNLATATEMYNIDGSAALWSVQGFFGRFNYDYKKKYLLEVNGRYDGSSRFPEYSRWGFFPSFSAGWQVDKESFWNDFNGVWTGIKLRGSYGELGNQNVGLNTFRQTMTLGQSGWLDSGTRLNYAHAPGPLPKVVTWETTGTLDLGVDLGFFDNKLTTSFDWYRKNTRDMYLPGKPLPAVFGRPEPRENLASLENKGFELNIGYNDSFDLAGSPFNLNISANVSNFKGYITKYDNPEGLLSSFYEGQRLGEIWGYHVDGQFQSDEEALAYQNSFDQPQNNLGQVYRFILNIAQNSEWDHLRAGDIKYIDVDGDGRIDKGSNTLEDPGDLRRIGNAMPQFPFGFNINAAYKGFDLSIAGAGVGRQDWAPIGKIYWGTYQGPFNSFLRKDLYENAWTPENMSGLYPQVERGYAANGSLRSLYEINDYYLTNIGFLRVKNLTLGYTLPQDFTSKFNIRKLRFYFSGENILTWRFGGLTRYIDPEQAGRAIDFSQPSSANGREDVQDYPMGKTYSIGLNIRI